MPSSNGSLGIPSIASDGIHVTAVTDFSTRMPILLIEFRPILTHSEDRPQQGWVFLPHRNPMYVKGIRTHEKLQLLAVAAVASALTALAAVAGLTESQAQI